MRFSEAVIAERKRQRRIARRIEALVVLIVTAAVLYVCTSDASASYNHVSTCKATLRGYYSDNDVRVRGVTTGAKSFGGWGATGHYSDGSAYAWGYFVYSYGKVSLARGRCSGGDFASDWFAW